MERHHEFFGAHDGGRGKFCVAAGTNYNIKTQVQGMIQKQIFLQRHLLFSDLYI